MDIYEIRRLNLIKLIKDKCDDNDASFARLIEKDPSYITRCKYPEGKSGKKRISDTIISAILKKLNLPIGWMDVLHDEVQPYPSEESNVSIVGQRVPKYNHVTIKQYQDVRGSMGMGIILQDQPGQIVNIEVTDEWYAKNVPTNTGKANLCIVTGFGDSMKGMFNPGDPLLVDSGVKMCDHDGVYFFRIGDEGFIKRLQRIPGVGIKVISKNPDYETWTITKGMDFQVLGKVLRIWESTVF